MKSRSLVAWVLVKRCLTITRVQMSIMSEIGFEDPITDSRWPRIVHTNICELRYKKGFFFNW